MAYGLILPLVAELHIRSVDRYSGAILATTAATATITISIVASASSDLVVAAMFVRGIWWWTAGKMWVETGVLPRWLGYPTMALAVLALGLAILSAPVGIDIATQWMLERIVVGFWTLALSFAVWQTRPIARAA